MAHPRWLILALLLGTGAAAVPPAYAQDKKPDASAPKNPSQASVASKTAKFATVAKTDKAYTGALKANDLAGGKKLVGKSGAFKGTVSKVFTPSSGSVVILNFDPDYKKALVAVVQKENFAHFPDLKSLEGKQVLLTGKFVNFQDRPELRLTEPGQVKLVK
jgi:hypothetical protein